MPSAMPSATPSGISSVLAAIAVRTVGYVAIFLLFFYLVELPDDDGLGTGLLAFATFVVVAFIWGGYDGWRAGLGRVAAVWPVVGVLSPLAMELVLRLDGEDVDTGAGELLGFVVLVLVLVAVPALVAGALGALLGRLRSDPAR